MGKEAKGDVQMTILKDGGQNETGLSTAVGDIAKRHACSGFKPETHTLCQITLGELCEKHVPAGQTIDFLKIDVEGMEKDVLLGADFKHFRPKVVLVESTAPCSQEETWQDWQPLITKAGYMFVYFDGLNRFYVAQECNDLKKHFKTPPCVWDNFTLARYAENVRVQQLENDLAALHKSLSWRVTKPLRALKYFLSGQKPAA